MNHTPPKIKSKLDAMRFVERIDQVAWNDEYAGSIGHPRLLFGFTEQGVYDPARRTMYIYPDGHWEVFSRGQSWRDQQPAPINNPTLFVWANRKHINQTIERLSTGSFYGDPFR